MQKNTEKFLSESAAPFAFAASPLRDCASGKKRYTTGKTAVARRAGEGMKTRKVTQSETAYTLIKDRLIKKKFPPGRPILEMELAEMLGMSRTPVHEAMRRLEIEGYIDIVGRKGAFAKYLSVPELIKCYEVSEGLEGMVGYIVADLYGQGRIPKAQFKEVDRLLDQMDDEAIQNDPVQWVDIDTRFHDILHELCENQFLLDAVTRLKNQFNYVSIYITPFYIDKRVANREHRDLVRFIREGDAAAAREVAQTQRRRIRNKLVEVVNIDVTRANA